MAEMSWLALLIMTTSISNILNALRWYKVPEVLVSTLGYIYRYIFLLFDEFMTMRGSAKIRGGYTNLLTSFKTSGLIVAQIFFRAYDRSERISQAIQVRGGE